MTKLEKPKIVVFDDMAAHGAYISRHFNRKIVYYNSNFKNLEKIIKLKEATFIFIVSEFDSVILLKKYLNANFNNVLICSESYQKESIPIDIPFDFISLNFLKDYWMKAIVQWLFDREAIKATDFVNNNKYPCEKYMNQYNFRSDITISKT